MFLQKTLKFSGSAFHRCCDDSFSLRAGAIGAFPAFFQLIMGEHLQYNAGYWPPGTETLSEAETAMLALTCERADLAAG